MPGDNPFVIRLQQSGSLTDADKAAARHVTSARIRACPPRQDIIREGDEPKTIRLFLSGWAGRTKTLEDGRRQTVALVLPGDVCDLHDFVLRRMDHTISAITTVTYVEIDRTTLDHLTSSHPGINDALLRETMVNHAMQREWTLNLGQRSASERIAHLVCELFIRLRCVGLVSGTLFEMPLTQTDVAEITGLSAVHVNRIVQELRTLGLIQWRGRDLSVPDLRALQRHAAFNPNYLHLDGGGRNDGAIGGAAQ